jgi:hypothetical protein
MPTVLRIMGYRFYFYMNEHLPRHIHVSKGGGEARIILEPEIEIDSVYDFKANEVRQILKIINENYEFLIDKWNETFDQ